MKQRDKVGDTRSITAVQQQTSRRTDRQTNIHTHTHTHTRPRKKQVGVNGTDENQKSTGTHSQSNT